MAPERDGLVEPEITINGTKLDFGQAMTVRVAIETLAGFVIGLPAKKRTGVFGGDGYLARINEIREYIFANQPRKR